MATMTLEGTLEKLEALGNEKMRAQNRTRGASDNQFGVQLGDIRRLAAEIKTSHALAIALWGTGNIDARLLAVLLIKARDLSGPEMDRMVRSVDFAQLADWLSSYVLKAHPDKEALRQAWMAADDPWAARALRPDLDQRDGEAAKVSAVWQAEILAMVRCLIHEADTDIVEERKWMRPANPLWGCPYGPAPGSSAPERPTSASSS